MEKEYNVNLNNHANSTIDKIVDSYSGVKYVLDCINNPEISSKINAREKEIVANYRESLWKICKGDMDLKSALEIYEKEI